MVSVTKEMEDVVEGTSVVIVSVKPEVISGRIVDTVLPSNVVNLEDKVALSEVVVMECEYISPAVDLDVHGDVCKEGTRYVET
jgi:hypothetical protein